MHRETVAGRNRGFTLLEMMVVLVVASLLFFVALPGYQRIMQKSYRAAGRGALLDTLSRQEQYRINFKQYAPDLPSLGLPESYYVDSQSREATAALALYKIELQLEESGFTGVRAVPQNRQRGDSPCLILSLSRKGVRAASGSLAGSPHECWR